MGNFCQLITSIWNIIYGQKYSHNVRITIPFLIIAAFMIALPITAEYVPNKNVTFWIILLEICMFYLALGVMQSSIFALGGILPGKYMGAIMMGNGFSAIFISLVRGICLLLIPTQLFLSVLIYFIIAGLCMVIAAFVHIQFQRNAYVRWHLGKTQTSMEAVASPKNNKRPAQNTTLKDEEDEEVISIDSHDVYDLKKINQTQDSYMESSKSTFKKKRNSKFDIEEDFLIRDTGETQKKNGFAAFFILLRRSFRVAWPYLVSIASVLIFTFIIFPTVLGARSF